MKKLKLDFINAKSYIIGLTDTMFLNNVTGTRVHSVIFVITILIQSESKGTGKLRNETKTKSNEICKVRKRNPTK
jgi:hypothetical protein